MRRHTKTGRAEPKSADSPRRSPRQKRAQATFDTILEAAAQILEKEGPDALTIAYLSDRSGYAIGTVYQYLPTKETIFHAIRERESRRIGEIVEEALASRDGLSIQEKATIVVDAVLDGFSARPQMRRHVIAQTVGDKGLAQLFEPLANIGASGGRSPRGFVTRHLLIGPVVAALFTRPELLAKTEFRRELVKLLVAYSDSEPSGPA